MKKSEVIGLCGGDEKTEWPRRTDKNRTLKKQKKTILYNPLTKWKPHNMTKVSNTTGQMFLIIKKRFDQVTIYSVCQIL